MVDIVLRARKRISDTLENNECVADEDHIFATACWVVMGEIDIDDCEVHPYSVAGERVHQLALSVNACKLGVKQLRERREERESLVSLEFTRLCQKKWESKRDHLIKELSIVKGKSRRKLRRDLELAERHLIYLGRQIDVKDILKNIPAQDHRRMIDKAKSIALRQFKESN